MRILILGATGNVGRALVRRLDHHSLYCVEGRSDADITNLDRLTALIGSQQPAVIINATAMNGMEACQADPVTAFMTNAVAPTKIAELAANIDALFIHFSTDYVLPGHDMTALMMDEGILPDPWGIYGYSKYAGELGIEAICTNTITLRLSSIYGDTPSGPTQVLEQARRGRGTVENPIEVLRQFTCPTSARLVADATAHIIDTVPCGRWPEVAGLYHFATSKAVWKKDFAKFVLGPDLLVVEGTGLEMERPLCSVLDSSKFERTFGYKIPTYEEDFRFERKV